MHEVTIPPLPRRPGLRAIIVEAHDIGGARTYSVIAGLKMGRPARRWWFCDRAAAWTHALELADAHSLALLDLSSEPDSE